MRRLLATIALLVFARAAFATCDGTVTTNRGLCKPNHGSYVNNWETVLNPNYDLLDFSCSPPLSCASTTISLGTVGMANGGIGQTTTTKGDVLVGTGSAWAKLGVGSDGQALISDSTQTNGVGWGSVGAGGGAPFPDSTSIVKGSSDPTKKARFEVDGFASGPTTHVYTLPDADGTIQLTGGGGACQEFRASVGLDAVDGAASGYLPISGVGSTVTTYSSFSDLALVGTSNGTYKNLTCRTQAGNPGAAGANGYTIKLTDDSFGVHSAPACVLHGTTPTCADASETAVINANVLTALYFTVDGTATPGSRFVCSVAFCPQ